MTITFQDDQWLRAAGYEYYCFISWPHINNKNLKICAQKIKDFIEQDLSLDISDPKVFLGGIQGGDEWEKVLRRSLCSSVVMVALCAPIYYSTAHKWCGLEWATMDMLSHRRLADEAIHAILPIIVKDHQLPEPISRIQYLDLNLSGTVVNGYYNTKNFQQTCKQIVEHIERVASRLVSNESKTDCDHFQLAANPAFTDYQAVPQPAPFRS